MADNTGGEVVGLTLLRSLWEETLNSPLPEADPEIDALITCQVVSIRYALLTQLLGKVVDGSRDVMSIQRGDPSTATAAGRWDARSFCTVNVVPWVTEASQVLGTSPDPYVNNPLRRPRLDSGYEPVRDRDLWDRLVTILRKVQEQEDPDFTLSTLRSCLVSLALVYQKLSSEFDVPQRVSLAATCSLIADFLGDSSGGERPQIITAALLRTIGSRFGVFDRVVRQGINEADAASERPGDVVCYSEEVQVLAVEVKDRTLELQDIETAIGKARRSSVTEVLFATTVSTSDQPPIVERIEREFALGINVYRIAIENLLRSTLSIAGESSRIQFLTFVGEELNDRVTQPGHKLAWQSLLKGL